MWRWRRRSQRDFSQEIEAHILLDTDRLIAEGLSPEDARAAALRAFGSVTSTQERFYESQRVMALDGLQRDLRYALRVMRKRPGFTALVIATLALGIGVNTTSLAAAYGILVRPLPYTEPSRVVVLNLLFPDGGDLGYSPAVLQDWLPRLRTVERAAGYYRREVTLRSAGRTTVVPAALVTDGFFVTLGTAVQFGHLPSSTDSRAVVLGRRWMNHAMLGEPSRSLGAPVTISDTPYTIGGVMPSDFAFPDDDIGLWLQSPALIPGTKSEDSGYSRIVARLKLGVTLEQVRDDANRVRLEAQPEEQGDRVS